MIIQVHLIPLLMQLALAAICIFSFTRIKSKWSPVFKRHVFWVAMLWCFCISTNIVKFNVFLWAAQVATFIMFVLSSRLMLKECNERIRASNEEFNKAVQNWVNAMSPEERKAWDEHNAFMAGLMSEWKSKPWYYRMTHSEMAWYRAKCQARTAVEQMKVATSTLSR